MRLFSLICLLLMVQGKLKAQDLIQASPNKAICKTWWNEEKTSKIQLYEVGNVVYGKVVWQDAPYDKNGKPRVDANNPEPSLRKRTIDQLIILKDYRQNPDNKNEWIGGKIYDPNNGKTYCGKITYKGNYLDLRGFICSISFLGRTTKWTLAE